jgi:hypothetical protein
MNLKAFVFIPVLLGILSCPAFTLAADGVAGKAKSAVEGIKENTSDLVDAAKDAVKDEGRSLKDIPLMPHVWAIPVVVLISLAAGYLVGKRPKPAAKISKDKPAGK